MARSIVALPPDVAHPFEVYVNGVPQRDGLDFHATAGTIVFGRQLRKDRVSRWRWFLGAWGIGTYRQDDTVDVRYEVAGSTRFAHDLPFVVE